MTAHITHFDLDGVVSGIFAKKMFPSINISKQCGYSKIDPKLDELISSGERNLIVTDLNFTPEQLHRALNHFDNVVYIDHHEGSEEHEPLKDLSNFDYTFNKNLSASALSYSRWASMNASTPELQHLALLADTFDMWRTDHPLWKDAYALNDLFWRYNFWGFEKKFVDGFSGFSEDERDYCAKLLQRRHDIIDSAPQKEVGDEGYIIMLEDREALGEVTLYNDSYGIYFIVYGDTDQYHCSVRIRPENVDGELEANAHEGIRYCVDKIADLTTGGGHKNAGGVSFVPRTSIKRVLDIIENHLYNAIKGEYDE